MIKRIESGAIVVPWKFSDNSRRALNKASEIATESQTIHVVHVAAPLAGPDNGVLYDLTEKQKIQVLKERFQSQLKDEEQPRNIYFHVEFGHVCPTLVRFAALYRADFMVMTERHRTGLSKLLFGRLAERVERKVDCPVHVLGRDGSSDIAAISPKVGIHRKIVHVQN